MIAIGTFRAIAILLATRALILLALLGAFVLAVMAMMAGTQMHLWVLIAYCGLTIGPLVGVELFGKRGTPGAVG